MNVLYVEDNPHDADLLCRALRKTAPQFHLDVVDTLKEASARLEGVRDCPYDLVLADNSLPDGSGLTLVARIRRSIQELACVLITGTGDEQTAVAALKAGADDYVVKRGDYLARIPRVLEGALRHHRTETARRGHPLRILYAEHNAADVDLTQRHLQSHAPHIRLAALHTADEVRRRLSACGSLTDCDVLLLDYRLTGPNGLEILKELRQERGLDIPVVIVSGQGDEEIAVQALRLGADDYLPKHPGYLYRLPSIIEDVYYRAQLAREQAALRESEERFRSVTESASDAMISVDANGLIVFANPAVQTLFGYTPDEVVGMPIARLMPQFPKLSSRVPPPEESKPGDEAVQMIGIKKDGSQCATEYTLASWQTEKGTFYTAIVRDITARKQAEHELLAYQNQLKSLASELTLTEERLRRNIAAQLHDQISQSLVLSRFKLESLRESVSEDAPKATLDEIGRVLSKTLEDSRHLTSELSYPILNVMGFEAAVSEWALEEIQQKHGIDTCVENDAQPKPLDEDVRAVLFRGVRELLMNVVKHARATQVKITMRRDGDRIVMHVKDNGIGLVTNGRLWQEQSAGFGLLSVVEAMERLGGQLHIESQPGSGCLAILTAPLNPESHSAKQGKS
jgi:PAS domain S-box-containing protein